MTIPEQAVEALVDAMLDRRFPKAVAVDLPVIEMLRDEARAYLEALLPLLGVQRPEDVARCKTPGATYHIRITSTGINAGVSLPRGITLAGLLDPLLDSQYRDRPDNPNIGKMYENIIHDALENALAKIIALNEVRGK